MCSVPVQSDLQENEKRWLIVGICLQIVISPVLRRYVDPAFTKLYKKLKKSNKLDIQTYPNVLEKYPWPNGYALNYESINNNRRHGRNRNNFDYKVTTAVDLSKLFLQPHMAHYTGFNDTCDSSALLGLIINIDKFQQPLTGIADKVCIYEPAHEKGTLSFFCLWFFKCACVVHCLDFRHAFSA